MSPLRVAGARAVKTELICEQPIPLLSSWPRLIVTLLMTKRRWSLMITITPSLLYIQRNIGNALCMTYAVVKNAHVDCALFDEHLITTRILTSDDHFTHNSHSERRPMQWDVYAIWFHLQ